MRRSASKTISVTNARPAKRSDPYEFYAKKILALKDLELLDAEPGPAWQGSLAHKILEKWHEGEGSLEELADRYLEQMSAHPLMRALWQPRLMRALEWIEQELAREPGRKPLKWEEEGKITVKGITIKGIADRIDQMPDGLLGVVDYKLGRAPSKNEVRAGYALQLGTLGLILRDGHFAGVSGTASTFEYWKLGKNKGFSDTGFGQIVSPFKAKPKDDDLHPSGFVSETEQMLHDALDTWILGDAPFTARPNPDAPGYNTYDHLMRLAEWQGREEDGA